MAILTDDTADGPVPRLRSYREWLNRERGLGLRDYGALWTWSTTDLAGFWESIWTYHGTVSPTPFTTVLRGGMPGATWFNGAQVNYAQQVFRHADQTPAAAVRPAIMPAAPKPSSCRREGAGIMADGSITC